MLNDVVYRFWSYDVQISLLICLVLYFVLSKIVEKNDSEAIWRVDALQKVLKEIHSLFLMFHGSIRALLEKEPAGRLIRSHLYPFIIDYLRGKSSSSHMPTKLF